MARILTQLEDPKILKLAKTLNSEDFEALEFKHDWSEFTHDSKELTFENSTIPRMSDFNCDFNLEARASRS